jgi:hypothetical protein
MDRPSRRAPHDLESVAQALRALGELRQALDDILREADRQIQRITELAQRRCAPLRRRARTLEHGLESFCASHPELLGPDLRLTLPEGSLGFSTRRALRPAPGLTWSAIAPGLARESLPPSPASPAGVDPQTLARLPEPLLHSLGIAPHTQTIFWCRPRAEGE